MFIKLKVIKLSPGSDILYVPFHQVLQERLCLPDSPVARPCPVGQVFPMRG